MRREFIAVLMATASTLPVLFFGAGPALAGDQRPRLTEEQAPMDIKFVRTGGYPYAKRGCRIDTRGLPESESRRLHYLIETSGLLGVDKQQIFNQSFKHDYIYDFTVKTAAGTHKLSIDEASMPVSFGPLVDYLEKRSFDLSPHGSP